jgi:hypothetical protein
MSDRELETFVIDYLRHRGSLVEPVHPDVYELLLPDEVAEELGAPAYQKVAFADSNGVENAVRLGYNHPLVEEIVTAARAEPAATRFYVNNLRLTKSGLAELAQQSWALPNSRVVELPRATIARCRSHYVRFNFKAALVSDDKQERLVSLLMDAHAGHTAAAATAIEQAANSLNSDVVLATLPDAPMRWQGPGGAALPGPLHQETLQELLRRAKTAVLHELSAPLDQLQRRTRRFRRLDEARLEEYYDDIEKDLKQRLATASPERRPGLQEKLAGVAGERAAKLADVAERYQVRLDLTLLNAMVIVQAKLVLPVSIENRTTKTAVYAVYDPLLHCLEPLVCAVCGLAGERTFLCFNGHVAHEDCLAPACIDCKRLFCRHCREEVGECDVCHEPLCRHSRIHCSKCGRGTCRAHVEMCHANEGQPAALTAVKTPPKEPEPEARLAPAPKQAPAGKKAAAQRAAAKKPAATKAGATKAAPKSPVRKKPALPKGIPKPQRLEVAFDHSNVVAYLLASRGREIARRAWHLDPEEGILVACQCEKGYACRANHMILRPLPPEDSEKMLLAEINKFRQEYGLPPKKVHYNRIAGEELVAVPRFILYGHWKDSNLIKQAQAAFDKS